MTLLLRFVRLRSDPHRLGRALALLATDERQRAGAFRRQSDHDRFVLARAHLRRVLGRHLAVDPGLLRFRYGASGKPVLAWPDPTLRFNLSHAGNAALIGVSRGRDVGVDLEEIIATRVSLDLARRVFPLRTVARLESLPAAERVALFFRAWTRMEARIKAAGAGLGTPDRWTHRVRSFSPAPGFIAAVALSDGSAGESFAGPAMPAALSGVAATMPPVNGGYGSAEGSAGSIFRDQRHDCADDT